MMLQKITLREVIASNQPRPLVTAEVDKLAASIKAIGLIQPITVKASFATHGTTEPCFQIVAGHHRVAACRALGWTEIDALVIEDAGHLQSELIEIDENLCRAELTTSQRTGYTKRRKQIWEALHPEEIRVAQAAPVEIGYGKPPIRPTGFAAATAEATGQSKATTNRAIARADALGDDALAKVANTSLDSGVELDALAKMPAPERTELIERAAAGEQVSARTKAPPAAAKPVPDGQLPIRLYKGVQQLLKTMGCKSVTELTAQITSLKNLTLAEQNTLDDALSDLSEIGSMLGESEC
jgi:ParB family chromosome partitioning protein